MSSDDDYYSDDEDEDLGGPDGGEDGDAGGGRADQPAPGLRNWLSGRKGWLLIAGLALAQALFATIMIMLRSEARPRAEVEYQQIKDLAVDMLGHEVEIKQIYQMVPMRGGKRMTIGLDMVLVLGQLPEERVEGAPRPTPEEFDLFIAAIRDMEPSIVNRVDSLLRRIPVEQYGSVEVYKTIKEDIKNYVNDMLDRLDFSKGLRPGIGKRRVTDVLLPMFVRQML